MSVLSYSSLPRLKSATRHDNSESLKEYKSGASFIGVLEDNKRVGKGIFIWPNGAKYEGDFIDNIRCGKGTQVWHDGTEYTGEFLCDMRHGKGKHKWTNGECYEGDFFKDRRHGKGTYMWPDGSSFTGTFYLDKKEGYGTFKFANGDLFVGLYKSDEREGPGVMTYCDKSEDVGLWHSEKLIQLCFDVPGAFSMTAHQEFEYKPEEYVEEIELDEQREPENIFSAIIDPPAPFTYLPESKIAKETDSLYSETLDQRSLAMKVTTFEEQFFKDVQKNIENEKGMKGHAWNNTPTCITMQRHIHRHRFGQKSASFDVACILKGLRGKHDSSPMGCIEEASKQLLMASMEGDIKTVENLLSERKVHVDVADNNGHTALLGAAVNWHHDIINTLLDNGADVNKLNNEGISALAACHVYFYPIDSFRYNIAERHIEPVPDILVSQHDTKGILANTKNSSQIMGTAQRAIYSTDSGFPQSQLTIRDDQEGKSRVLINEDAFSVADLLTETESKKSAFSKVNSGETEEDRNSDVVSRGHVQETIREENAGNFPIDKDSLLGSDNDLDENIFANNTAASDFASDTSVKNFEIEVLEQLVERCATQLSMNERVISVHSIESGASIGSARCLAVKKARHSLMEATIRLLLKRGADPNASYVPMPVLFFAIKSADVDAVQLLLSKKAHTYTKLSDEKGGLAPLHIAAAISGDEGVEITRLLLDALANPDVRSTVDDSFLNKTLEDEWSKDVISEFSKSIAGGRTPLHIACARDDSYKHATKVVHLLLDHHGNPNLLCNGHSPLSLAIASGNDMALEELLQYGADPSLPLTHGIGSALCVATSTEYEHRRTPQGRIALVEKLIRAGANILAPIFIGPRRITGTAVDAAYYMFNMDRRIAHMPYHALTHAERDTYNARRRLLSCIGDILRTKVLERERARLEEEERGGKRSISPSPGFTFIGAGAELPPGVKKPKALKDGEDGGHVSFKDKPRPAEGQVRKPLFKYCYECGRSVGVRLSACTRCKEVYYCSKSCKLKAWNARHKDECIRISGRSPSPGQKGHGRESPTPGTNPDKAGKTTVKSLMADKNSLRIKVPFHGKSKSAKHSRINLNKTSGIERNIKTAGHTIGKHSRSPERLYKEQQQKANMDNYSFE